MLSIVNTYNYVIVAVCNHINGSQHWLLHVLERECYLTCGSIVITVHDKWKNIIQKACSETWSRSYYEIRFVSLWLSVTTVWCFSKPISVSTMLQQALITVWTSLCLLCDVSSRQRLSTLDIACAWTGEAHDLWKHSYYQGVINEQHICANKVYHRLIIEFDVLLINGNNDCNDIHCWQPSAMFDNGDCALVESFV